MLYYAGQKMCPATLWHAYTRAMGYKDNTILSDFLRSYCDLNKSPEI